MTAVCVKAAPGLPADLIPPGWEAEFIAEGRDLKEAVLWSPALATAPPAGSAGPRRATRMSGDPGRAPWSPTPVHPDPVTEPGEYLLDPNPAVTRAGLVEDLARSLADGGATRRRRRCHALRSTRDRLSHAEPAAQTPVRPHPPRA